MSERDGRGGVLVEAVQAGAQRDRALRADRTARDRARGVVHTPLEVAWWMARAVDERLRGLGLRGGLADPNVVLLDPACGTGVFLAAALEVGRERSTAPQRALGLDSDPAVLREARSVVGPAFEAAGWPLDLRVQDALTFDRRAAPGRQTARGKGATWVVLGNPPWAVGRGRDQERAPSCDAFRLDHRGQSLGEKRVGVLADDYVRFFGWAAQLVRAAPGGGVLAYVTNASFIDGVVHRGMRAALGRWFEAIDVVMLGGSALVARQGPRDENVFGVRPAAAISILSRSMHRAESVDETPPSVARFRYAVLRGSRTQKLDALQSGRVTLRPTVAEAPRFLFRPAPEASAYDGWLSLPAALPFHREGIQTNRDAVVVDPDRGRLLARLHAFVRGDRTDDLEPALTPKPHYCPDSARQRLAGILRRDPRGELRLAVRPLAYRPFDARWFTPVSPFCHRPRPALLRALDHGGVSLLTVRQARGDARWSHFGAAVDPVDNCWLSTRSSCRTRVFPAHRPDGTPNLETEVVGEWWGAAFHRLDTADFISYSLAILAAPTYRATFDAVLRSDYPRLPPPLDRPLFEALADAGRAVAAALTRSGAPVASRGTSRDPTVLGHGRYACVGLARAIAQADVAVQQLLGRLGVSPPRPRIDGDLRS